ncbi:tail fiber assembly protein [Enterobacter cloacae subsp. cloacae]|uniref:tail fiber assembly protein n=1 Tax=Enterobacter cloacae TaxID=550 RepID=UPI0028762E55|nr:tail fiber assembly protein [Enterobacter cloacae]MDR9972252.1 tail fiber assembly protein [Enterobacter cloacae subsp. cloacae]MDS0087083.1 tail fiber assembly protein [Enterobacter cloacae subsp. cloacae]
MAIFFSPSNMGFYDDVMKADYETANSWPADLTPVSERWYQSLIKGQSEGKVITLNEYGYPVLSDPEPPTQEQLVREAESKKQKLMQAAGDAIAPLQDAEELGIATEADTALLIRWKRYRVMLNRLDTSSAPSIEWPERPA